MHWSYCSFALSHGYEALKPYVPQVTPSSSRLSQWFTPSQTCWRRIQLPSAGHSHSSGLHDWRVTTEMKTIHDEIMTWKSCIIGPLCKETTSHWCFFSLMKNQKWGVLIFSLLLTWTRCWRNSDLRCQDAYVISLYRPPERPPVLRDHKI